MNNKEFKEKAIALLKLVTAKNTQRQEREAAIYELEELIKEHDFPDLLFHPERSEEQKSMMLIYRSLSGRIVKEMRDEEKRARIKSRKSETKTNSLVAAQYRRPKGLERLMQVGIVTDRDFNMLYQNPERGTKLKAISTIESNGSMMFLLTD